MHVDHYLNSALRHHVSEIDTPLASKQSKIDLTSITQFRSIKTKGNKIGD